MTIEDSYRETEKLLTSLSDRDRRRHVKTIIEDAVSSRTMVAWWLWMRAKMEQVRQEFEREDTVKEAPVRLKLLREINEFLTTEPARKKAEEELVGYLDVAKHRLILEDDPNVHAG